MKDFHHQTTARMERQETAAMDKKSSKSGKGEMKTIARTAGGKLSTGKK